MRSTAAVLLLTLVYPLLIHSAAFGEIYRSQGEMAGEVTETSVILQTRLTSSPSRIDGDVPGAAGIGRFEVSETSDFRQSRRTAWLTAEANTDFILKTLVDGLAPATRYYYRVEFGPNAQHVRRGPVCTFRTLQGLRGEESISFVVVTGMNYVGFHFGNMRNGQRQVEEAYTGPDKALGYPALKTILEMKPDFFVGTGDNVYYDSRDTMNADTIDGMRRKWHEQFSQPRFVDLWQHVPTYWEKDDHDHRYNDCDRTGDRPPSSDLGIRIFREQVPIVDPSRPAAKTYRTYRVSKHLQIWLVEGRDYRSPNKMPDGPDKTLWGPEQLAWLKRTLLASDATFKLLISPTPLVGPDDAYKIDNHTNHRGFRHEGRAFFAWIKEQQLDQRGFYTICGDRHWQYHSADPTGIEEFSCGALVDANSRLGRKPGDPESTDPRAEIQQFYTQSEPSGGFLRVTVGDATAVFEFFDELGELLYRTEKRPTDDLSALDQDGSQMLYEHLLASVHDQYDRRRKAVERALRSDETLRERKQQLRDSLKRVIGELPDSRSPLNSEVTGVLKGDGFRIEKVVYQSRPRHYVTANLYIPTSDDGPFPGVLIACGHSGLGKAYDTYQRAAILMARHGMVALVYDPCGQGERLSYLTGSSNAGLQHKLDNIGAVLVGRSAVGYQAWDGIRGIDYLLSRPEVDSTVPIGMTGNSGGGAQTMYLMALDDRIGPAAPSCHITTLERNFELGASGDGCQSAPFTGYEGVDHPDFFTIRAPRPTIILSAEQDYKDIRFTRRTYQEVRRVYDTLGHPSSIDMFAFDDKHSFSKPRRQAATSWMKRWLLGDSSPTLQDDDESVRSLADLQVTRSGQVLREWTDARSIARLNLSRARELSEQRRDFWKSHDRTHVLSAVRRLAGIESGASIDTEVDSGQVERSGYRIRKLVLYRETGFPLPSLLFLPGIPSREVCLYIDGRGKEAEAAVGGDIEKRVLAGTTVLSVDLRGWGETTDAPSEIAYRKGDHRTAMLSLHIGKSLLGQRVEDTFAALDYLLSQSAAQDSVHLVGVGQAGPVALHAAALDDRLTEVTLRDSMTSWVDDVVARPLDQSGISHAVPGALQFYDLPDLAAVIFGVR